MRLKRAIPTQASRRSGRSCVLTIGSFDGLHLGHQEIVRRTAAIAEATGAELAVLSFEPTPAEFFARGTPPARLTCFRERYELLARMGVDLLVCPHFRQVNVQGHERFASDVLVGALQATHVVVGHDFRYGAGRAGTAVTLGEAGAAFGFGVTVVDAVYLDGERVSSTLIRSALQAGDLAVASRLLGRDYSMSGRVVHGRGLGRDLGIPTANVNLKRRRAPVDGVFAVQVDGLGGKPRDGVASVGNRPTIGGGETLLEVHLFDFDELIYGAYITVRFKMRLRAEENFASIAELKRQMHADVAAAKAALGGRIA